MLVVLSPDSDWLNLFLFLFFWDGNLKQLHWKKKKKTLIQQFSVDPNVINPN